VIAEPYLGIFGEVLYVTLTVNNPLNGMESVAAVDLNMDHPFFKSIINKFVDPKTIAFYFFATAEQMVM
jgi:hypothetical protein